MMMKRWALSVLLCMLLLLSACTPPLEKGYVYAKQYTPAWTQLLMQPYTFCTGSGVERECITNYTYVPVYHAEQWNIDITSCTVDQKQNCQTNEIAVDAATYSNTAIGQYVDFSSQG